MPGSPTLKALILRGDIGGLKQTEEKLKDRGVKVSDMALLDLWQSGAISKDTPPRNADSET